MHYYVFLSDLSKFSFDLLEVFNKYIVFNMRPTLTYRCLLDGRSSLFAFHTIVLIGSTILYLIYNNVTLQSVKIMHSYSQ